MPLTLNDALEAQKEILRQQVPTGEVPSYAYIVTRKSDTQEGMGPFVQILHLGELDDRAQRVILQVYAETNLGFEIIVVQEVWVACVDKDDAEGLALIERLREQGSFADLPEKYKSEAIRIHTETLSEDLRCWTAPILRSETGRRLGNWEEVPVKLPYFGFRRYLPSRPITQA